MNRSLALIALVALATVAVAKDEYGKSCENENDCADEKGYPLCRYINYDKDGEPDEEYCVECDFADGGMDSTCPPGKFCVNYELRSDDYGYPDAGQNTCVKKKWPLGEQCDPAVTSATVRKGDNEELFCGYVSRWCNDDSIGGDYPDNVCVEDDQPAIIQWVGSCIGGKCYECIRGGVALNSDKGCQPATFSGLGGSENKFRGGAGSWRINQNATLQLLLLCMFLGILVMILQCALFFDKFKGGW